jgi:hypothetical protein
MLKGRHAKGYFSKGIFEALFVKVGWENKDLGFC